MKSRKIRFYKGKLRYQINGHDYEFFTVLLTWLMFVFTVRTYTWEFNPNLDIVLQEGRQAYKYKKSPVIFKTHFFFNRNWQLRLLKTLPIEQYDDAIISWHEFWRDPSLQPQCKKWKYNATGGFKIFKEYDSYSTMYLNTITYK